VNKLWYYNQSCTIYPEYVYCVQILNNSFACYWFFGLADTNNNIHRRRVSEVVTLVVS
jgi:hypothetical protein